MMINGRSEVWGFPVSEEMLTLSRAYLYSTHMACCTLKRATGQLSFEKRPEWKNIFTGHVSNIQNAIIQHYGPIIVFIGKDCPAVIKQAEAEFENYAKDFLEILGGGNEPLSEQEKETAKDFYLRSNATFENISTAWKMLVSDNNTGMLPEWIDKLDIINEAMQNDVSKHHNLYDSEIKAKLEAFNAEAGGIQSNIRTYFAGLPHDALTDRAVCVLLSAWNPLTCLVAIQPAVGNASWVTLRQQIIECEACINKNLYTMPCVDSMSAASVTFFASTCSTVVNDTAKMELKEFQAIWITQGDMIQNIINTYKCDPKEMSRSILKLETQDALDYWDGLKDYVSKLPKTDWITYVASTGELP